LYDIRLLLTAAAVLVILPAAAGALRRGWQHRPQLVGRVMLASLVLGTAELVARAIPPEAPTPPEPENAPPAVVTGSTWAWGLGELLAVLLLLGGAGYVSRLRTRRRTVAGALATAESVP
jgi:hypothetical protein